MNLRVVAQEDTQQDITLAVVNSDRQLHKGKSVERFFPRGKTRSGQDA